jgi:hypothetical protein
MGVPCRCEARGVFNVRNNDKAVHDHKSSDKHDEQTDEDPAKQ